MVEKGDAILKDQVILELENEKTVSSVLSTTDGVVSELYVQPGDQLSVGQRILSLTSEGESADESGSQQLEIDAAQNLNPSASDSIRKLACELGIDLTRVRGSEQDGQIILSDLKAYIQALQANAFAKKSDSS